MSSIILDCGKDLTGSCLIEGYVGKVIIMSYNYNIYQPMTEDVRGIPQKAGAVQYGGFSISKYVDIATPELHRRLCCAAAFPEVKIIDFRTQDGEDEKPQAKVLITLHGVTVSGANVIGGTGGAAVENVTLTFTGIELEVAAEKADGTKEGKAAMGWDLGKAKASSRH